MASTLKRKPGWPTPHIRSAPSPACKAPLRWSSRRSRPATAAIAPDRAQPSPAAPCNQKIKMARLPEEIGFIGGDHVDQMDQSPRRRRVEVEQVVAIVRVGRAIEAPQAALDPHLQHGLLVRTQADAGFVVDQGAEPVEIRDWKDLLRVRPWVVRTEARPAGGLPEPRQAAASATGLFILGPDRRPTPRRKRPGRCPGS